MTRPKQLRSLGLARLAGMAGLFILLVAAIAAQAQTFSVLHSFTGGGDGATPYCRGYRRTLRGSVRDGGRQRKPRQRHSFQAKPG